MKSRRNDRVEDKHLQILKDLQKQECNKRCFECDQRGPTYIDVTIGSFVCTTCGGVLRGINPPHRVKSISMATFTSSEISLIQSRGNDMCKRIYLGKYDERSKAKPESKGDTQKLKMFMEQKYEQKRWYVPPEKVDKPKTGSAASMEGNQQSSTPATKPLSSVVKNPVSIQVAKKPPARPPAPSVGNILDGFDSAAPSSTNSKSSTPAMVEFADFGNAFAAPASSSTASSSPATFDAFADFSTMPNASAPSQTPLFDAFSTPLSQPSTVPFSTPASAAAQPAPPKPKDKYADLGDLFNLDASSANTEETTSKSSAPSSWGFSFTTPPPASNTGFSGSVFGDSSSSSVFGNNSTSQASSVFQSTPQATFSNTSQQQNQSSSLFNQVSQPQAFSSSSSQSTNIFAQPQQSQPNNFSNTNLFQQPSMPAVTASINQNPFSSSQPSAFNNAVPPQQNAFSQQNGFTQAPQQNAFSNAFGHPAMKTATAQQPFSNMQPQQAAPAQNSSNPFFQAQSYNAAPTQAVASTNASNPFLQSQPQQSTVSGWGNQFGVGNSAVPNNNINAGLSTNPFTVSNVQHTQQVSTNPFF